MSNQITLKNERILSANDYTQNSLLKLPDNLTHQTHSPVKQEIQGHSNLKNQSNIVKGGFSLDQSESFIYNHTSNEDSDNDSVNVRNNGIAHHYSPNKIKYSAQEEAILNSSYMKMIPPPLPILPKYLCPDYEPPKCPMRNINFIQLKKFLIFENQISEKMNEGYDQISTNPKKIKSDLQGNSQEPQDFISNPSNPQSYENEIPQFINNIVFCRDPSILNDRVACLNLKNLMQHENILDIKQLIKEQASIVEVGSGGMMEDSSRNEMKKKNKSKRQQSEMKMALENESAQYHLADNNDKTLLFESKFESGNLYLAQKLSDSEYNLLMQNDINTQGHTQWFYFRVQNTRKGQSVKFNIINYSKPDSLFNYGMKVTLYSEKKASSQQMGWHRGCHTISYFANGIKKDLISNKSYYTLTFTYDFEFDSDTVFFSYCFPYTYSDLIEDLIQIDMDPLKSQEKNDNMSKRKAVVISGRVHPGETVGSWMMRGVLKFITDPHNHEAKLLRENFIFKIIPMLNPDGVINGNYRCSMAGCDLNRRWKTPSKIIHPEIYHTKKMVKALHAERGVLMFCDLHGHSRKQNVFMYGCNNAKQPEETRIFPYLLSKLSPFFSFEYSRFGNQKSKESTARISLFKDLKTCPNIFTMESTFSGMDKGIKKGMHISTDDLESLGRDLCRTILVYSDIYVPIELENLEVLHSTPIKTVNAETLDKKKFKEDNLNDKQNSLKSMLSDELKCNKDLMKKGDGDSSSGSDSAPSEDNLNAEDIVKIIPIIDKKTKQDLQKIQKKKLQLQKDQSKKSKQLKKLPSKANFDQLPPKDQGLKKQDTLNQNKKSTVKFPLIEEEKKKVEMKEIKEEALEEDKDLPKKKPKPDMVDAWTQTDRSDYSIIKSRMLSHQQYANTLMKQHENPLRLKAQKNYQQQYARTPTQVFNGVGSSGTVTQNMENILSSSSNANQLNKNRYNNIMGQSQNDLQKNFRSPQNQRNIVDQNNRNNIFQINNQNKPSAKPEVTSNSFKGVDSQIKVQLNNSQFKNNQFTTEQRLNSLSIEQQSVKKLSNRQVDQVQNIMRNGMPSPLNNPLNSLQQNTLQMTQNQSGLINGNRTELLFPVLRNKYHTANPAQISQYQLDSQHAQMIMMNGNGQTEKVLISEKKPVVNTNPLSNPKHTTSQKKQRHQSGVRTINSEKKQIINTIKNGQDKVMMRRNSYKSFNNKI